MKTLRQPLRCYVKNRQWHTFSKQNKILKNDQEPSTVKCTDFIQMVQSNIELNYKN